MHIDLHPSSILNILINSCCISTLLAQDVYINIYTGDKDTFNLVAGNWQDLQHNFTDLKAFVNSSFFWLPFKE